MALELAEADMVVLQGNQLRDLLQILRLAAGSPTVLMTFSRQTGCSAGSWSGAFGQFQQLADLADFGGFDQMKVESGFANPPAVF